MRSICRAREPGNNTRCAARRDRHAITVISSIAAFNVLLRLALAASATASFLVLRDGAG